ncbi:Unknown protein, partial [Striga hermonthica]
LSYEMKIENFCLSFMVFQLLCFVLILILAYLYKNACTYFSWVDPELGPFQKSCFLKLKAEKALLEEQLKCRDVTEVALVERLKMKEDELLYLKSKVNELEEQVQVLSKRNRFRYPIV